MNEQMIWGLVGAILGFALKELFTAMKGDTKKNTEATQQNTHAIIELKIRLEHLNKSIDMIPKMKKDIDALHDKVRHLQ